MADHDPYVVHDHHTEPVVERSSGLTGYAIAKYGFILLIVIVVLFFIAKVLLPAIT